MHAIIFVMRIKRGFALAYTLLVAFVVFLFAAALFARSTQTLRLSAQSGASVKATALADTGAQVAFCLMRDNDSRFYETQGPLRSQDLGPDFAPDVLGGTFEVQVDRTNYSSLGLYPDHGTFYILLSTGRVGSYVARTSLVVKRTNPLMNNLILASADLTLSSARGRRVIRGPITVNADPASGQPGDLRFVHEEEVLNGIYHRWIRTGREMLLATQVRASGQVYIHNDARHGLYTAAPLQMSGKYRPPDFLQHQDFQVLDAFNPAFEGKITMAGDVSIEPNAKFSTAVPSLNQLLKSYRVGGPAPLDISPYPEGVLVEFHDGQVTISQARTRLVGRVYDRALALEEQSELLRCIGHFYQIPVASAQSLIDAEVAIDDPDFPNDTYPADLGPGSGDYTEVRRIERGPALQTLALSNTTFSPVYLTTSRTDYLSADGSLQGPPVFVRGMVDGKCVLAYDVTDDTLDPSADRLHMIVLGEHEDPSDSPGLKLAAPGPPGVVGGLIYADRTIKANPDQPTATDDQIVLLCRGSLSTGGDPAAHRKRMHDTAGLPYDYQAVLLGLDQAYSRFYTGSSNNPDFCIGTANFGYWSDDPRVDLYGMGACASYASDGARVTSLGQVAARPTTQYPTDTPTYGSIGVTPPPGRAPGEPAYCLQGLRRARVYAFGGGGRLRGCLHSLVTAADVKGDAEYDYNWRDVTETQLRDEMKLPVSAVPISWERL